MHIVLSALKMHVIRQLRGNSVSDTAACDNMCIFGTY